MTLQECQRNYDNMDNPHIATDLEDMHDFTDADLKEWSQDFEESNNIQNLGDE